MGLKFGEGQSWLYCGLGGSSGMWLMQLHVHCDTSAKAALSATLSLKARSHDQMNSIFLNTDAAILKVCLHLLCYVNSCLV